MTFEQLRYFVEIYEQESFSFAAETLSISQSSLSKHMKNLENEIGNLLFDTKNKRKFIVTEAGHDFYTHAKKLIVQYDEMRNCMKEYLLLEKGNISISSIPVKDQYGIIGKLTKFMKEHPHITTNFMEEDIDTIISQIYNNKVDMGILYDSPRVEAVADTFTFGYDEFVAVVPKEHPLSNKEKISPAELKNDPFILLKAGSDLYYAVIDLCQKSGFTPQIRFQNSRTATIVHMIEETKSVAILIREIVEPMLNENIKMIPLTDTKKLKLVVALPKGKAVKPCTIMLKNFIMDNKLESSK